MKTDLNHDRIDAIIENARKERSVAMGRLIATGLHKLLDWIERCTQTRPQPKATRRTDHHLSSEGARPNVFDTSAFV